jgi:hypothetical protein
VSTAIGGERCFPGPQDQKWQPVFSEPKLVDAAVESVREFFIVHPDAPYIAFSIQDGHEYGQRDMNSEEVKEQGKLQGLSNLYWAFMNKVAERLEEEFPDKKIVGLAYSDVRMPPPFKLHENTIAWLVFKMADIEIDNRFRARADGLNYEKAWAEAASAIGVHDWAYGLGFLFPRIYTRSEQRTFLEFEKMGAPLRYAYSELGANWGLDGPKVYLLAKLWWDPHTDIQAELRRFCDDLFGKAGQPMYEYFVLLETLYCDHLNRRVEQKLYRWERQFVGWSPDVLAPDLMTIARRGDEKAAIQLVDQALDRITKDK